MEVFWDNVIEGASASDFAAAAQGRTVASVTRRAKNIVVDLSGSILVVNLGMTGRLMLIAADAEPGTHPAVRFGLDDGSVLLYHDVRRFGRLQVMSPDDWIRRSGEMGFEPLSDEFTPEALYRLTRGSRVAIKTWLMDQKRVVGVGNIYASEALWRARISPRRGARRLTRAKAERLHAAVQEVLRDAIEHRGTTFLDYRDAAGNRGGFVQRLAVYDRSGEPCPRCGTAIRRIVQGARSTFFCPDCQTG